MKEDLSAQEIAARADRLREAVRRCGGPSPVAKKAGMPVPTLNNYLSGRDMKAAALVALARATNVSVGWLAAGIGSATPLEGNGTDPLDADLLEAPAHFWGLHVSIRSAQFYFENMGLVPSLRDVLLWIKEPYRQALETPDRPIELKGGVSPND